MMPVAQRAREPKKPSAKQLSVLRRMIERGEPLNLYSPFVALGISRVPRVTYTALRVNGWIEPAAQPYTWRVSDAGRRAAE